MGLQTYLEHQAFYFCCQDGMKALNTRKMQVQFFLKGSLMLRRVIRFVKMRIFGLGQGTSRIQSALLPMPLAQLRQKIIVWITNSLLLVFNADIKASCNCVKTTAIQQKTIDSIQAWADLCILSVRRMVAGTCYVPPKVWKKKITKNKFLCDCAKTSVVSQINLLLTEYSRTF